MIARFKLPQGLFWDYLLLVMLAAMFGASFMMTKVAVVDVPPTRLPFPVSRLLRY